MPDQVTQQEDTVDVDEPKIRSTESLQQEANIWQSILALVNTAHEAIDKASTLTTTTPFTGPEVNNFAYASGILNLLRDGCERMQIFIDVIDGNLQILGVQASGLSVTALTSEQEEQDA